ncbi:MAG: hypothetical protein R3B84_03180 [Zavarzinella sp.]
MSDSHFLDLLNTLGRETCEVLSPIVGEDVVEPNDGYELFSAICGREFDSAKLDSLTAADFEAICENARDHFECDSIELYHIREIASKTIDHWPIDTP